MLKMTDEVSKIKGIGTKKQEKLANLGIRTVEDLLNHVPVKYRDRREVLPSNRLSETKDREQLAEGVLIRKSVRPYGNGRTLLSGIFADDSGEFRAVFFNMPFLSKNLTCGERYVLFGKIKFQKNIPIFQVPEICKPGSPKDVRGIIPVYRSTAGISSADFGKWVRYTLSNVEFPAEWLPKEAVEERKICTEEFKYRNLHFPESGVAYRVARTRYVYEILFLHQTIRRWNQYQLAESAGDSSVPEVDLRPFLSRLDFVLTEGQIHAVQDISADLSNSRPMNRLVQGDVGCGKTVVAEAAMYQVACSGGQCVFMAPTEILARQHFEKVSETFEKMGVHCVLLISALSAAEKRNVLSEIKSGSALVVIGTHAIIQDNVIFRNLQLVITDEQHRFGVNQRRILREKTNIPNVLVMSATPIPRTLQATVYGDMDFSMIRTKPNARKKIITRAISKRQRQMAYAEIQKEVEKGNRAYIVVPSIEEGEGSVASVEKVFEDAQKILKGSRIAAIHGRMKPEEKESIMTNFAEGRLDVLVATVVIEVGIDVPEATIMVIENADRFGLAQLHQLRGRVGRSNRQSYCWLVNYSQSETALERLRIMQETDDGFIISEEDYRLRGPGDIHGTMQHGNADPLGDLTRYEKVLACAAEDVRYIDPGSIDEEIRRRIHKYIVEDYENTI